MEFAKKHKNTVIAIIIFFLVLIVFLYFNKVINTNENKAVYGTRLDKIKDVKISDNRESQVEDVFASSAEDASVREQGRIIEINVVLNKNVTRDKAKDLAKKVYNVFSDKERKAYDIQIFFSKNSEDKAFPIIGYAHHNKSGFSWTKDR